MAAAGVNKAILDVQETIRLTPLCSYFAWLDVTAKYRRSILGPLWVAGGIVSTSLALSLVFGAIFGQPLREVMPYIMSGMLAWQLAGLPLNGGSEVFVGSAGVIKSQRLPFSFHTLRFLLRELIIFAHNIVVYFLVLLLLRNLNLIHWQFIPALIIVSLFGLASSSLCGLAAARYRDLRFLLPFTSQIVFFMTPIFWRAESIVDERAVFYLYNPFYYFVTILRNPFLGVGTPLHIWTTAIVILAVTILAWLAFFAVYRRRIAFWV